MIINSICLPILKVVIVDIIFMTHTFAYITDKKAIKGPRMAIIRRLE